MKAYDRNVACRAAVLGLGLIGGSCAAALGASRPKWTIVGYDADTDAATRARDRGLVHEIAGAAGEALAAADVIVLATPVGAILETIAGVAAIVPGEALLIDVGSTKGLIVQAMSSLPARDSGRRRAPDDRDADHWLVRAGRAALRTLPICAVANFHDSAGDARLGPFDPPGFRRRCHRDGRCRTRPGGRADQPSSVSSACTAARGLRRADATARSLAAGGFRARVQGAGDNIPMWHDILRTNRRAIATAVGAYRDGLERLQAVLLEGFDDEVRDVLTRAAKSAQASRAHPEWRAFARSLAIDADEDHRLEVGRRIRPQQLRTRMAPSLK